LVGGIFFMMGSKSSKRLPQLLMSVLILLTLLLSFAASGIGSQSSYAHSYTPSTLGVGSKAIQEMALPNALNPLPRPCQQTVPALCLSPQQFRTAYNIQAVLDSGITGKGRSITIIDAYQSPTITQDLAAFDAYFGLNDPKFNIIAPFGLTPFDPANPLHTGWAGEITLDVEWAHAVAPDATINLVLAPTSQDADILKTTKYAIDHHVGDVISMSFGSAEQCIDPKLLKTQHQLFFEAAVKGITLVASDGDWGKTLHTCYDSGPDFIEGVNNPSSDPFVLSVGGTKINVNGLSGTYISEVTWNEPQYEIATGGGYSQVYSKPFYQYGAVSGNKRGQPDVAFNAAVDGGVLVVYTPTGVVGDEKFLYRFAGTSASAPEWAGIIALTGQKAGHRLGLVNDNLYRIARTPAGATAFHDITVGDNTFTWTDATGTHTVTGDSANAGWDAVTGLGTPVASKLIPLLAGCPVFSADQAAHMK
jgi:subtilase family serine protease